MSDALPFIVGSQDQVRLTLEDRVAGVDSAIDLTGATVTLKAQINSGTVKTWAMVPDPDQSTYRGRATYELAAADIDVAGTISLQAVIVAGGRTFKSQTITRSVAAAIV